ncbi:hypothetical protein D3C84_1036130 [compost metagenome]
MVVKTRLPDTSAGVDSQAQLTGRTPFEHLDHAGQSNRPIELEQPMQMVWHQHPGERAHHILIMQPAQLGNGDTRAIEIPKQGAAVIGCGGDVVDLANA